MATLPLNLDAGGTSYAPGQLFLVDGQGRFCTKGGLFPTLRVDTTSHPIIGIFPMNTTTRVGIAHIPGQTHERERRACSSRRASRARRRRRCSASPGPSPMDRETWSAYRRREK